MIVFVGIIGYLHDVNSGLARVFIKLRKKYFLDISYIESNFGQNLFSLIVNAKTSQKRLPPIPIVGVATTENNNGKSDPRLGPLLENKILRLRYDSSGDRLPVSQLKEIPIADHNDVPDAMEKAIYSLGHFLQAVAVQGEKRVCQDLNQHKKDWRNWSCLKPNVD